MNTYIQILHENIELEKVENCITSKTVSKA